MEDVKTYTPADCIGQWDREIPDPDMEKSRASIFPLQEDNINHEKHIGKWDDEVKD